MSAAAQYLNDFLAGQVTYATAGTDRIGTNATAVCTARTAANGGKGAKVVRIRAEATGTTTAGMLRFYRYSTATAYLLFEIPVSAIVASGTVRAWSIDQVTSPAYTLDNDGAMVVDITLAAGESLRFAPHNAESFTVTADYGEF
jgi:hypothetical protein